MTAYVMSLTSTDPYHALPYSRREFPLNGTKILATGVRHSTLNAFNSDENTVARKPRGPRLLRKAATQAVPEPSGYSAQPIQKLNFQNVTLLTRDGAIPSKAKRVQNFEPEFAHKAQPIPVKTNEPVSVSTTETVSVSATDRLQKALLNLTSPITKPNHTSMKTKRGDKLDERAKSDTEVEPNEELSFEKLNIPTIGSLSTPKNMKTAIKTQVSHSEKTKKQLNRTYSHSTGEILKPVSDTKAFLSLFSKSPKNVRFAEELENNILNSASHKEASKLKQPATNEKFAFSKSQVSPDPKNIPFPKFLNSSLIKPVQIIKQNAQAITETNNKNLNDNVKEPEKAENRVKPINAFLSALKKLEQNNN